MTVETPKAKVSRPRKAAGKLAIALHRINGVIEPGTPVLLSAKDYKELVALEAVRELTEGEDALFEKNPASVVALSGDDADDDAIAAALG